MRTVTRLVVALGLIVPLLFVFGGGWLTTFAIALFGFGTGRAVERLVFGPTEREPGKVGLWLAAAMAVLGLVVLAGVEAFEYRLRQRQQQAIEEKQRQEEALQAAELAARAELAEAQAWQVEVLPDGSLLSEGQPVALEALAPPAGATRAQILAGEAVPYERVIAVMDRIREAGVGDIALSPR